mmetsp:Transcript_33597/g.84366  ORF Transcript_33597/g.84366 Transcript_33597/m.84366 type:complete len:524 (-) Transcript_33597:128-1699(-)|eukprot:CAMPEP_0177644414 /NCGR_PEP_ID=MMETSP0447-20121125/8678_1 /TAXON_ID=0 /ORGANISM="Stygamoeba regulata, Strain BSH-02190019" /LENGTH=523 /DNA_ID=CAMNT_0019146779 /DNA_START=272 /DNA_END=1843 /DNA_ORIENTATION=+
MNTCVLVLLLFHLWNRVGASLVVFDHESLPSNTYQHATLVLWDSHSFSGAKVRPHMSLDLNITQVSSLSNGFVELFVLHSDELSRLGWQQSRTRVYCCQLSWHNTGRCEQIGRVIHDPGPTFFHRVISLKLSSPVVNIKTTLLAEKSGAYHFYLFNCKSGFAGEVLYNGRIEAVNPYGYLAGELYFMLPISRSLLVANAILLAAWCFMMRLFPPVRMPQILLCTVMVVSTLDSISTFVMYRVRNEEGSTEPLLMAAGFVWASLGAVKSAVAACVILLIAGSYGICSDNIVSESFKAKLLLMVLFAALLVFVFQLSFVSYLEEVGLSSHLSFSSAFILHIPMITLALATFAWFIVLQSSVVQIGAAATDLQRQFCAIIVTVTIVMIVLSFGSLIVRRDTLWKWEWLRASWFDILFFIGLLLSGLVWRPSEWNEQLTEAAGQGEMAPPPAFPPVVADEMAAADQYEELTSSDDEEEDRLFAEAGPDASYALYHQRSSERLARTISALEQQLAQDQLSGAPPEGHT